MGAVLALQKESGNIACEGSFQGVVYKLSCLSRLKMLRRLFVLRLSQLDKSCFKDRLGNS